MKIKYLFLFCCLTLVGFAPPNQLKSFLEEQKKFHEERMSGMLRRAEASIDSKDFASAGMSISLLQSYDGTLPSRTFITDIPFSVGEIGKLPFFQIVQIIDADGDGVGNDATMLVQTAAAGGEEKNMVFYLTGYPTSGMIDDQVIKSCPLVLVRSTKTYNSVSGATRTVFDVVYISREEVMASWKPIWSNIQKQYEPALARVEKECNEKTLASLVLKTRIKNKRLSISIENQSLNRMENVTVSGVAQKFTPVVFRKIEPGKTTAKSLPWDKSSVPVLEVTNANCWAVRACSKCNGTFKVKCLNCIRNPKLAQCRKCNGSGKIIQKSMAVTGRRGEFKTPVSKKIDCDQCSGGKIPCTGCKQTGLVPCPKCSR